MERGSTPKYDSVLKSRLLNLRIKTQRDEGEVIANLKQVYNKMLNRSDYIPNDYYNSKTPNIDT
jgi:hypothetical protein